MQNKNNWIIVLIIVLAIVGFYFFNTSDKVIAPIDTKVEESTEVTPTSTVTTPKPATSTTSTLNYTEAQKKYKGKIIQFDQQCRATPRSMTFTNNTYIMLDNRASVARTIKVGTSYSIGAYGFKVVKASVSKVPGTLLVDCGGQQNVATISIQ